MNITVMSHELHGILNHWQTDCLFNSLFTGWQQTEAMHHWRESTGDCWIPMTKGWYCKKCFHAMTLWAIFWSPISGRVMVASSSSINLFSSREQEFEQRAQLLKRLSFTIFCSEEDQYQRYMPDIQGNKKLWMCVNCCGDDGNVIWIRYLSWNTSRLTLKKPQVLMRSSQSFWMIS